VKSDLSLEARNRRAAEYLGRKESERMFKKSRRLEVFMGLGIPVVVALLIVVLWVLGGGVK
jgi:hypothetical protein